jgi:geranylgeranyl diphosphate synthase, type II
VSVSDLTAGGLVEDTLRADGDRTRAALLRYIAGEGSGELYDIAADYPTRPGKGMRPALCLAACRAHGGDSRSALGAAMAIELLHNAFLVHDDICDSALRRRGEAALHVLHGIPLALSAGDAMAVLSLRPLLDDVRALGDELALDVLAEFQHLMQRTIEGQAVELGWRARPMSELDADAYLRLILDKTCWYTTIHPCRVGALIGSRGRADLDGLARFGFFLGAVFQIRDDIENVTHCAHAFEKDYGSDIIEGKPTLLLMHVLQTAPPSVCDAITQVVGDAGERCGLQREERIEYVIAVMERTGSIDYARGFADALAGAALAEFDAAMGWLPETRDKAFLRSLVLHLRNPVVRGR